MAELLSDDDFGHYIFVLSTEDFHKAASGWAAERAARKQAEAERDEALNRVDDLETAAGVMSAEFEGDCWKAMRALLDECEFPWADLDFGEGISADDARLHISETLRSIEDAERNWRARAERAEADLAGAREAALREMKKMHWHKYSVPGRASFGHVDEYYVESQAMYSITKSRDTYFVWKVSGVWGSDHGSDFAKAERVDSVAICSTLDRAKDAAYHDRRFAFLTLIPASPAPVDRHDNGETYHLTETLGSINGKPIGAGYVVISEGRYAEFQRALAAVLAPTLAETDGGE